MCNIRVRWWPQVSEPLVYLKRFYFGNLAPSISERFVHHNIESLQVSNVWHNSEVTFQRIQIQIPILDRIGGNLSRSPSVLWEGIRWLLLLNSLLLMSQAWIFVVIFVVVGSVRGTNGSAVRQISTHWFLSAWYRSMPPCLWLPWSDQLHRYQRWQYVVWLVCGGLNYDCWRLQWHTIFLVWFNDYSSFQNFWCHTQSLILTFFLPWCWSWSLPPGDLGRGCDTCFHDEWLSLRESSSTILLLLLLWSRSSRTAWLIFLITISSVIVATEVTYPDTVPGNVSCANWSAVAKQSEVCSKMVVWLAKNTCTATVSPTWSVTEPLKVSTLKASALLQSTIPWPTQGGEPRGVATGDPGRIPRQMATVVMLLLLTVPSA